MQAYVISKSVLTDTSHFSSPVCCVSDYSKINRLFTNLAKARKESFTELGLSPSSEEDCIADINEVNDTLLMTWGKNSIMYTATLVTLL